jgi:hypothetical protein
MAGCKDRVYQRQYARQVVSMVIDLFGLEFKTRVIVCRRTIRLGMMYVDVKGSCVTWWDSKNLPLTVQATSAEARLISETIDQCARRKYE